MIGSAIPSRRPIRPRVLKYSQLAGWRYTILDEEEQREGLEEHLMFTSMVYQK